MQTTRHEDWAELRVGDYRILNNVWAKKEHVPQALAGQCRQVITADPDRAGGTVAARFAWSWPLVNPHQVLAYPEIILGKKPWDASTSGRLPRPLKRLRTQRVRYDYTVSSNGAYNVAFDCWILREGTSGPEGIVCEVMVWIEYQNMFPIGVAQDGPRLAVGGMDFEFWSGERRWPTYTYQCAGAPVRDGRLDLGIFLSDLRDRGLVRGDHWLGCIEFGSEVIHGTGQLEVERYQVL